MRQKSAVPFGVRTAGAGSREIRRKFFLVYEGTQTEYLYFDALDRHRNQVGLHPLVELIPLLRDFGEHGHSNPRSMLEDVEAYFQELAAGKISCRTLLRRIVSYYAEEKGWSLTQEECNYTWYWLNLWAKRARLSLETVLNDIPGVCAQIASCFSEDGLMAAVLRDLPGIITNFSTYDAESDRICLIFDRDRKSFRGQYTGVLKSCRKNRYGFYVSNPCFEFWLLLHFDDAGNLEREKLLENAKTEQDGQSCTYAELELRRRMPDYTKTCYRTEFFMGRLDRAIANAKAFCTDEERLEREPGGRVGVLIEEMRRKPDIPVGSTG